VISDDGHPLATLYRGCPSVLTMTSVEDESCGEGSAGPITVPGRFSVWPRSPYIVVPLPWENTYDVSKRNSVPPALLPPPPVRSPRCFTLSSRGKSSLTTRFGKRPMPNANSESKPDSLGKRADSDTSWFRLRHRFCNLLNLCL
jgi:hypothetical protein